MTGNSRQRTANVQMGRWRITEMDLWEQDDVDLVAPGFVEFGEDHRGSLGFIAVQGVIDWREAPRNGLPGAEFTWEGFDEGDPVNGCGWMVVEEGGSLFGRLYFHLGDDSGFRAERMEASRSRGRTYGS
jgi:hypothetical protein